MEEIWDAGQSWFKIAEIDESKVYQIRYFNNWQLDTIGTWEYPPCSIVEVTV